MDDSNSPTPMPTESLSEASDPGSTHTYADPNAAQALGHSGRGNLRRGDLLGRFVVLDPLGAGGMGMVFSAFDPQLDRKVAIKILHPQRTDPRQRPEARRRILREAQALAKLKHGNVLTIFEVGARGDDIFLATELVEGQTLKRWLTGSRSRQEILRTLFQAGDGLAAAHRAGIVHRDFKPSNIMVDPDGRAVVLDFGLARSLPQDQNSDQEPSLPTHSGLDSGNSTELDRPLTRTGRRLGTPGYMAPEQQRGERPAAAADQYSFCLTLFEALTGRSPQPVVVGSPSKVPAGLSSRLWRVLERGLHSQPDQRFASMDQLLDELRRGTKSRRRFWSIGALGLVAPLLFWLGRGNHSAVEICAAGSTRLEQVWNESRRQGLRMALGEPTPQTSAAARQTVSTLDSYGLGWRTSYTETCEATHLRGEQSTRLLDLRMGCLERRRQELSALVEVLLESETSTPDQAVEAVSRLRPPADCADARSLLALIQADLPAAQAQQADALRSRLMRAEALSSAGRFAESLEISRQVADEARALDDWALTAEAQLALGHAHAAAGNGEDAEKALIDSALAANVSHHYRVSAEALTSLVAVMEYLLDATERATQYSRQAASLIDQIGSPPLLTSQLLTHTAMVSFNAGDYRAAETKYRSALEQAQDALGDTQPQIATLLTRLGNIAKTTGDPAAALPLFERALNVARTIYGPDHVEVARILSSYGGALKTLGEFERALAAHGKSLEIARQSLGNHFRVANLMTDLGNVYLDMDQPNDALALYDQARPIYQQTLGEEHPIYSIFLTNVGLARLKLEEYETALDSLSRAVEMKRRIFGAEHPQYAGTLIIYAGALEDTGRRREALSLYQQIVGILEQAFEGDHYLKADGLFALGSAWLDLGQAPKALPHLEACLAMRLAIDEQALLLARSRFVLARALIAAGGDWERARDLAQQARNAHIEAGKRGAKRLAEIETWIRDHFDQAEPLRPAPTS